MNESFDKRKSALTAGILCAFRNWLQFQGGYLTGFAAADMVQAFLLLPILWDYFLFNEFQQTTLNVSVALVIIYLSYLFGISMLSLSISE
jgi:hypothetical protein